MLNYLRDANVTRLESGDFSKCDATAQIRKDTIDSFDFVKMRNF